MYDQENLSDEKKINRVGNAVVDGLQAKGFKLNEQEVQDIFAEVAKQMKMHRPALLKLNHADIGKAGKLPF